MMFDYTTQCSRVALHSSRKFAMATVFNQSTIRPSQCAFLALLMPPYRSHWDVGAAASFV